MLRSLVKYSNKCTKIKVFEYFFCVQIGTVLNIFLKNYSNTNSEYYYLYIIFIKKILSSEPEKYYFQTRHK